MDLGGSLRVKLREHLLHGAHYGHQLLKFFYLLPGEIYPPFHLYVEVVQRLFGGRLLPQ